MIIGFRSFLFCATANEVVARKSVAGGGEHQKE